MFQRIWVIASLASLVVGGFIQHNILTQESGSVLGSTVDQSLSPTPTLFTYIIITATPIPTSTPTPTPLPTSTPIPTATSIVLSPSQFDQLFTKYSNQYSVNVDLLRKIARCESNFHPTSQSEDYAGMYQFSTSSWAVTRQAMNEDANPALRLNPEEAIKTAAYKIKMGGISSWPMCSR